MQRKSGGPVPIGTYKWNPQSITLVNDLCKTEEQQCSNPERMFNLTNKLLTSEKFNDGRQIFHNFR